MYLLTSQLRIIIIIYHDIQWCDDDALCRKRKYQSGRTWNSVCQAGQSSTSLNPMNSVLYVNYPVKIFIFHNFTSTDEYAEKISILMQNNPLCLQGACMYCGWDRRKGFSSHVLTVELFCYADEMAICIFSIILSSNTQHFYVVFWKWWFWKRCCVTHEETVINICVRHVQGYRVSWKYYRSGAFPLPDNIQERFHSTHHYTVVVETVILWQFGKVGFVNTHLMGKNKLTFSSRKLRDGCCRRKLAELVDPHNKKRMSEKITTIWKGVRISWYDHDYGMEMMMMAYE